MDNRTSRTDDATTARRRPDTRPSRGRRRAVGPHVAGASHLAVALVGRRATLSRVATAISAGVGSRCRRCCRSNESGASREAHLPTQHPSPGPQARVPRPHEHSGRSVHPQGPAAQGPYPSVGLIGRIHERREFERLSRHGRRARTETLWCRYLDEPQAEPPRIAFAIGRAVGPAVVRNRLRRRLRALAGEHARAGERSPAPPRLTCSSALDPAAAERSFEELRHGADDDAAHAASDAGPDMSADVDVRPPGADGRLVPAGVRGSAVAVPLHPVVLVVRPGGPGRARQRPRAVADDTPARCAAARSGPPASIRSRSPTITPTTTPSTHRPPGRSS